MIAHYVVKLLVVQLSDLRIRLWLLVLFELLLASNLVGNILVANNGL
jgi:hypothetical protein